MEKLICSACGGNELDYINGFYVCKYCGTKFIPDNGPRPAESNQTNSGISKASSVGVNDDIQELLKKCESDPKNARKYASLILDMDPTNRKAKKILSSI